MRPGSARCAPGAAEPVDRRSNERSLVGVRPELPELDADEPGERALTQPVEHIGHRDRALAESNGTRACNWVAHGVERLTVLEVSHSHERCEQLERFEHVVSHPQRIRRVEADAERRVIDPIDKLSDLRRGQVAVILERELEPGVPGAPGRECKRSDCPGQPLVVGPGGTQAWPRCDDPHHPYAELGGDVEPSRQVIGSLHVRAESQAVRAAPGQRELQLSRLVEQLSDGELGRRGQEARLQRHALGTGSASVGQRIEAAARKASAQGGLTGPALAEKPVVGVAVDADTQVL